MLHCTESKLTKRIHYRLYDTYNIPLTPHDSLVLTPASEKEREREMH